jgi:hypothetical protein
MFKYNGLGSRMGIFTDHVLPNTNAFRTVGFCMSWQIHSVALNNSELYLRSNKSVLCRLSSASTCNCLIKKVFPSSWNDARIKKQPYNLKRHKALSLFHADGYLNVIFCCRTTMNEILIRALSVGSVWSLAEWEQDGNRGFSSMETQRYRWHHSFLISCTQSIFY